MAGFVRVVGLATKQKKLYSTSPNCCLKNFCLNKWHFNIIFEMLSYTKYILNECIMAKG